MTTRQFSVDTAKDILSTMCLFNEETLDASTLPSGIQNTESLLSTLFESIDSISPLMILSESREIMVIKDMKKHVFPKSEAIFFASKIAPVTEMGIVQTEHFPFNTSQDPLVLPTSWQSGDFESQDTAKETVEPEVMVYFPHVWLHLLVEDDHLDRIDPNVLLQRIIPLRDDVPEETASRVIKFLIQCILEHIPTFGFRTTVVSSKKGKSTQDLLLADIESVLDYVTTDNLSVAFPTSKEETIEELEISEGQKEDSKFQDEDPLSPNSKRFFLMMKAQLSSLNDSMVKNLSHASETKSTNILKLEDKEGFLKKLPDHSKEVFINLRTGPSMPEPTDLDPEFSATLTKVKSKSHAFDQILFQIAKNANKKDIDCLIDSQTLENFFKLGEVRNKRPIISFDRSFGLNNFALGPSSPTKGTFMVTSDSGNKHISFVADNVAELIAAYKNLKYFTDFITGTTNSFASQGLSTLITFLDDNSIMIKESARELPNFIAELQIQTGNTWARFVTNCAHEKPSGPPDFSHFIDAIESGRTFATVLRKVPQNTSFQYHQNKRPKLDKNDSKEPAKSSISKNSNPQMKIEGADEASRYAKFKANFPDASSIKALGFPPDHGKPYCLRFAILHECKSKFCRFSHKAMPSDTLHKFLEICSSKNLGISKK
jgi:hypothetical protein